MITFKSLKLSRTSEIRTAPAWLPQFLKFIVVGFINTGVDWGIFALLTGGAVLEPVAAKAVSYSAGVVNSYLLNRCWTFSSGVGVRRSFTLFMLTNLCGTALNVGMMSLATRIINLPPFLALVLATVVTMVWNFLLSRYFIFRPVPHQR